MDARTARDFGLALLMQSGETLRSVPLRCIAARLGGFGGQSSHLVHALHGLAWYYRSDCELRER